MRNVSCAVLHQDRRELSLDNRYSGQILRDRGATTLDPRSVKQHASQTRPLIRHLGKLKR
jgi:hypothetical protein